MATQEKSGFFNSNGGDRLYSAVDFASYFGNLVSNGIFYRDVNNLKVSTNGGMNISVAVGSAFINGYNYQLTEPLILNIATASGTNPRIDRVVVRLDMSARAINLVVKTGTATANPTAPELTRTADIYELGIADIFVQSGAVAITSDNISDTRLNENLCGLVNSLISAVYE